MKVKKYIDLLGLKAKDRVTGLSGTIDSISFDLYGCVSALVTPPAKDNKTESSHWYDLNRLEIDYESRVMEVPNFDKDYKFDVKTKKQKSTHHGPADKPVI